MNASGDKHVEIEQKFQMDMRIMMKQSTQQ